MWGGGGGLLGGGVSWCAWGGEGAVWDVPGDQVDVALLKEMWERARASAAWK